MEDEYWIIDSLQYDYHLTTQSPTSQLKNQQPSKTKIKKIFLLHNLFIKKILEFHYARNP